jgi:phenylalanyl-tRNA synthetase beta chain
MANVKFPRKEIEKHFKLDAKMLDRIMMLGIPVESLTNEEIEIQVLPNRPDLLSMQGFLRTVKAFIGKDVGLKKYKVNPPEKNYKVTISKSTKDIRPYTACAIVKNLQFDDVKIKEIIDIQEKLHITLGRNRKKLAIGIYPLEKITLPIKFEARKPEDIKFIPLEMPQEMNGLQILQRHPTGREYAPLLEGKSMFPVFVDAKNKVLSMPPIINSHETGKITKETKEVFIECSGFDLEILKKTLNIVVTSLAEMGGKIFSMDLEYEKPLGKIQTPNLLSETIKVDINNVNKLLGLSLTEKDLEKLLPRMGYDYSKGKVSIPAYRTDILHEVDIIEDIAIAYGYENIKPIIPEVATIGEEAKSNRFNSKVSDILSGLGLLEISTFYLIKPEEAKISKLQDSEKIELEDSKSEYKLLRPNLIIPGLRILSENKDNEYPQKIFELGSVFKIDRRGKTETGIEEDNHLCILSTPGNFTEQKQILDYLMKMLNLSYELKETNEQGLIEGRTGRIIVKGKEIGFIGEVHPETLSNWGIKMPVALIEINLSDII